MLPEDDKPDRSWTGLSYSREGSGSTVSKQLVRFFSNNHDLGVFRFVQRV